MNHYHDLANAKDLLRQAKDHYETTRAVVEMGVMTLGKTVEDRKRELIVAVSQDVTYQGALADLRAAEYAVDTAQAVIDQLEAERREREWAIRARLTEALSTRGVDSEDDAYADAAWESAAGSYNGTTPRDHARAQRNMDEVFGG